MKGKQVIEGTVQEKVWGPDDTYLTVEVQVDSGTFHEGESVKVTVEKKKGCPPECHGLPDKEDCPSNCEHRGGKRKKR